MESVGQVRGSIFCVYRGVLEQVWALTATKAAKSTKITLGKGREQGIS